jgi:restriction system protein
MNSIPRSQDLIQPTLTATSKLGGQATIREIETYVAKTLNLSEDALGELHSGSRTEFQYRMAWARTKAKSQGFLESPKREVWKITEKGISTLSN